MLRIIINEWHRYIADKINKVERGVKDFLGDRGGWIG
jgi:hypothetical protein